MTVLIEYKSWKLPPLKVGQIVALADEVYAERRSAMLESAKQAGMSEDAKRRMIADMERERGLAADVIRWAHTARGTMRVVEESLALHGNGLTLDSLGLDLTSDYGLALRLLGFEPSTEASAEDNADPTAVPPQGGT